MNLGKKIKKLRGDAGLSYVAAAEQLRASVSQIQNWESGQTKPSADSIRSICRVYGVSSDWLLGIGAKRSR